MLPTFDSAQLIDQIIFFLPEALICAALVVMLLIRLGPGKAHMGGLAAAVTFVALLAAGWMWYDMGDKDVVVFSGMAVTDPLTRFARFVILGAALLTIGLTLFTGIPDVEDSADFHVLLLGGTLGMLLMASADHLLMVYIAVEMASLPSYALAGFLKGKRQGSEAALKYVVYGGGASGVMLFGISLLAGRFGTGYLPDLAKGYNLALQVQSAQQIDAILVLGTLLVLVGLAFKLSAVPFHFWCPDVFEGAAAEVAAFLSVASKAAAFVLTARLILAMTMADPWPPLLPVYFGPPLAFLAALTATFGNLAAYPQDNLKRLLAYSTIAHAGYMLMGLATVNTEGVQAVLFYLASYVFMNLGAFAVVAILRNRTGSEDLTTFRGLVYRSPGAVVLMGVFLLSLLGIPPLVGFVAKFQVFAAVFHAGRDATASPHPWLGNVYYALLVIGGLNTAFSAFYYVRVLKVMILDRSLDEVEGREPPPLRIPAPAAAYTGFLAAAVVGLGVAWNFLAVASADGVKSFADMVQRTGGAEVRPDELRLTTPGPAQRPQNRQQPRPQPRPKSAPNKGGPPP
jgi:NADH-quinone oxidoreductase subunit N